MPSLIVRYGLAAEVLERHRRGDSQESIADFARRRMGRPYTQGAVSKFLSSAEARKLTMIYRAKDVGGDAANLYLDQHRAFLDALYAIGTDTAMPPSVRVKALAAGVEAIPEGFELVAESVEMRETIEGGG